MIAYPTSNDITVEMDGRILATVQNYRVRTVRESRNVSAFGYPEPVCTLQGRTTYKLELSRVIISSQALNDGVNFHNLSNFEVVVCRPDHRVVYSGCEWDGIEESASLGSLVLESVSIVATRRDEFQ